jgi:hypothetical protein
MQPEPPLPLETDDFDQAFSSKSENLDLKINELEKQLEREKDARNEDRFIFIACVVILLNVVFFSVMPSFGGPLALLILELLVLIPLARRMGMEEVAGILDRVLYRVTGKSGADD